jgi:hypothetical protein
MVVNICDTLHNVEIAVRFKHRPYNARANVSRPALFCEEVFVGPGIHLSGVKVRTVNAGDPREYIWITIPTKYAAMWKLFGRNLNSAPLTTADLVVKNSTAVSNAVSTLFPRLRYREAILLRCGPSKGLISPVYTMEKLIEAICKAVVPWAAEKAIGNRWDAKRFCRILLVLLDAYFLRYGAAISTHSCKRWLGLHWFQPYMKVIQVKDRRNCVMNSTHYSTPFSLYFKLMAPYILSGAPISIWAPTPEYNASLLAPPKDIDYICFGLSNIRPVGFEEYLSWSPRLYETLYIPTDDQDDIVIFPSNCAQDTCILRLAVKGNDYYADLKRVFGNITAISPHIQYLTTVETIRLFPSVAGVKVILRNISNVACGPRLWHDFRAPELFQDVNGRNSGEQANCKHLYIGVNNVIGNLSPVHMLWDIKLFYLLYRKGRIAEKGVDVFKPLHPGDTFILRVAHDHPWYQSFVKYIETRQMPGKHTQSFITPQDKILSEYLPYMKSFVDHCANSGLFPHRQTNRMLAIVKRFCPRISCRVTRREAVDIDMNSKTLYEKFGHISSNKS